VKRYAVIGVVVVAVIGSLAGLARAGQLGDDRHREPHGRGCGQVLLQRGVARPRAGRHLDPPPPLPPSHTVSGYVSDDENRPIANATVTIEDTPITPATTDAGGRHSFERMPTGT
jgi:hypothetical protein